MKPSTNKSKRNLRALFTLAFFFSITFALGGGGLLYFAFPHPESEIPVWQFGQWILSSSIIHLVVYFGLFCQVRKLRIGTETEGESK